MFGLEYIRVQVLVQLVGKQVCKHPTQEKQARCHNTTAEVDGKEESRGGGRG